MESFTFAIQGVLHALRHERNMRIHVAMALLVFLLGLAIGLTRVELALLALLLAFVICLELVNTAIEAVVDLICPEKHPLAAVAKNVAAGAVFVAASISVVVGYLLFFERLVNLHPEFLARTVMTPLYVPLVGICVIVILVLAMKAFATPFRLQGGMPSGHAAVSSGLATAIFFLSESGAPVVFAVALALLVAQSRVEGRIHTVPEVVLGSILGVLVVLALFVGFQS